jgi:hypothetical protein
VGTVLGAHAVQAFDVLVAIDGQVVDHDPLCAIDYEPTHQRTATAADSDAVGRYRNYSGAGTVRAKAEWLSYSTIP